MWPDVYAETIKREWKGPKFEILSSTFKTSNSPIITRWLTYLPAPLVFEEKKRPDLGDKMFRGTLKGSNLCHEENLNVRLVEELRSFVEPGPYDAAYVSSSSYLVGHAGDPTAPSRCHHVF